jgi:hypothetical protein
VAVVRWEGRNPLVIFRLPSFKDGGQNMVDQSLNIPMEWDLLNTQLTNTNVS